MKYRTLTCKNRAESCAKSEMSPKRNLKKKKIKKFRKKFKKPGSECEGYLRTAWTISCKHNLKK